MKNVYLDNAATTMIDPKVVKTMHKYLTTEYGNASSIHFVGQSAKRALEESRKIIASSIGAKLNEIVFTGSGTEANNMAIKGLFWANYPNKNHIITTKIEHDCVLNACKWVETQGGKVTYLDVDKEGFVDIKQLENSISEKTILVSVIHGHNEVGTIQDLDAIGEICKKKKVLLHTDACQSYTKVPINVNRQNIDLMTINAHKIHGPKGVGALYIKNCVKITPLLHGGGQENGFRSSTENLAGIAGFAKAVKAKGMFDVKRMNAKRDYFISKLEGIGNVTINGARGEARLCNNVNVCFNNIEAESIGSFLNAAGIYTSVGSACSSHKLEASHVLLAMGKTHLQANSSVRISISKYTTMKEINYAINEIKKTTERLRKISPFN